MAYLYPKPIRPRGFGSDGATALNIGASLISTGLSLFTIPILGVVLAVLKTVIMGVYNHQQVVKAHRQMREQRQQDVYLLGRDLISQVYGIEIPGWSHLHSADMGGFGEYYQLGSLFTMWSAGDPKNSNSIAGWLLGHGLEPTRFLGYQNVNPGYSLDYSNYEVSFVADPEKALVAKEALVSLGYDPYQINTLSQPWLVRWFDILLAIPRTVSEAQARLVKIDMETHLKSGGLDPKKIFGSLPSEEVLPQTTIGFVITPLEEVAPPAISYPTMATIPAPTGSGTTVQSQVAGEGESKEIEVSKASISPLLAIGLIGAAIMMLGTKKKKEKKYVQSGES
jgi:hypothetical protein